MLRLPILTVLMVLVASFIFLRKGRHSLTIPAGEGCVVPKDWLVSNPHPVTPVEHIRPADQTFLTYPEWFLVHSPAEIADYAHVKTTTTFPYVSHIKQLWQSYSVVYDQIKGSFPFNTGYHIMIWVIGVSTTVEYAMKSLYETIVGRLTNPTHGEVVTDEDKFNARFAQDYVDFIRVSPWYEFDFASRIPALLSGTSFFGTHFLRKCDRKYMLLTELLVKAGYGYLIKLGTKASYDEALPTTAVIIDQLPTAITTGRPGSVSPTKTYADGSALLLLPRYEAFHPAVSALAQQGVTFREIAGNNSALLLTVLAPATWQPASPDFRLVFTQPILTKPGLKRVALVTQVKWLDKTVRFVNEQGVKIEHVYDY
ncbi:hypothetical protein [Spirosoma endophyticum]|uniref:Uncharacterized protein n=1 Tax=Spirosoma endophyticum TaxID=662367 RepID=A0A1I1LSQ4_9BACT|nr:hypothetical protein [Spirosoma endophyticum]SFC73978.1 hypothetical protein SAMN05216167_102278 [Spirosoma endophyticum]